MRQHQLGIKKSGWLAKDNLVTGIEYTRNRPFVYANINPVLNYTNHAQLLGDWMGNNADRVLIFTQFTPLPRLYATLSLEYIRKGGAGSTDDQYLASPQPTFMFSPQFNQKSISFEMNYQLLQNIKMRFQANSLTRSSLTNQSTLNLTTLSLGILMGL